MARSDAITVQEYLSEMPPDRATVVAPVRDLVNQNLPVGYEEAMNWGMIVWQIPLSTYPYTHNKQPLLLAALANQKNYISLYLNSMYAIPQLKALLDESGKKLKMGKSCINFNRLDELPLEAIAGIIGKSAMNTYIAADKAAHT